MVSIDQRKGIAIATQTADATRRAILGFRRYRMNNVKLTIANAKLMLDAFRIRLWKSMSGRMNGNSIRNGDTDFRPGKISRKNAAQAANAKNPNTNESPIDTWRNRTSSAGKKESR